MRIGRTLPPAAAPIFWRDIVFGMLGLVRGHRETERFVRELKACFKKRHCFLVSSGKAALTLILLALKETMPKRNQVLIPAFTCYSVPSAIVRAGLNVVLCDINPETLDFDFEQLAEKLESPRLLCVVPNHLFGLPADIGRLKGMIRDPAVTVVEDAAQAMGGRWKGRFLGTLGETSFFSLGRGKAFSTVEGGIILTDDEEIGRRLAEMVEALEDYRFVEKLALVSYSLALAVFLQPRLFWFPRALPFLMLGETIFDPDFKMRRMTPFQAGLSRGWAEKLEKFRADRKANADRWKNIVGALGSFPGTRDTEVPDLTRFPLKTRNEVTMEQILKESSRKGLGIARTYPDSIDSIPALCAAFTGQEFPYSREAARVMVTLPVHGFLRQEDRGKILELLAKACR
jgi:perosamine synthetase